MSFVISILLKFQFHEIMQRNTLNLEQPIRSDTARILLRSTVDLPKYLPPLP